MSMENAPLASLETSEQKRIAIFLALREGGVDRLVVAAAEGVPADDGDLLKHLSVLR